MNKHPSAQKRHRQSLKRHDRNQAMRSRVRTFVKRVRESVEARNLSEVSVHLASAVRTIDKAVTKGVLHRNTAARKISRLTRAVRKLTAPA
jgi:small subunit ribosomal protein S20